jgi:hypothetical protein
LYELTRYNMNDNSIVGQSKENVLHSWKRDGNCACAVSVGFLSNKKIVFVWQGTEKIKSPSMENDCKY